MSDWTPNAIAAERFAPLVAPPSSRRRRAQMLSWQVEGVGTGRMAALAAAVDGGFEAYLDAPAPEGLEAAGLPAKVARRLSRHLSEARATAAAPAEDLAVLHLSDPAYPKRLFDLDDPPVFLFVRGNPTLLVYPQAAALVGSRDITAAQERLARRLSGGLAEAGTVVISGGARGADAAAHAACLDAGVGTVAVLPGGLDRLTPRRNQALFERIATAGALVSEYPFGVGARRYHFHRRNRLIAALGQATVVVRAGRNSGTLITARAAAELGRPRCVLACGLDEPNGAGCLELLVGGAQCVRDADDVLVHGLGLSASARGEAPVQAELPVAPCKPEAAARRAAPARQPQPPPTLGDDARAVFDAIATGGAEGMHLDAVVRSLGWQASRLSPALLELELAGLVAKVPGAQAYRLAGGAAASLRR